MEKERFFDIEVDQFTFTVYPDFDFEEGRSLFAIGIDGIDYGTIHKTENDTWGWIDRGIDQEMADQIGARIEAHYE